MTYFFTPDLFFASDASRSVGIVASAAGMMPSMVENLLVFSTVNAAAYDEVIEQHIQTGLYKGFDELEESALRSSDPAAFFSLGT